MNIDDSIPDFSLRDANGILVSSKDLINHWTILYFYPKDDTPGCTKEACDFRDAHSQLIKQGIRVIGVSPDSAHSHQQFSEKHTLNFPLLCDEHLNLAKKFKVVNQENRGIERSTFIINPDGKIVWKEQPVSIEGHTDRIIEALEQLKK